MKIELFLIEKSQFDDLFFIICLYTTEFKSRSFLMNKNSASVYSVFDDNKIALNKFRSSEPVRKSRNL